jgi:hypothetical protein
MKPEAQANPSFDGFRPLQWMTPKTAQKIWGTWFFRFPPESTARNRAKLDQIDRQAEQFLEIFHEPEVAVGVIGRRFGPKLDEEVQVASLLIEIVRESPSEEKQSCDAALTGKCGDGVEFVRDDRGHAHLPTKRLHRAAHSAIPELINSRRPLLAIRNDMPRLRTSTVPGAGPYLTHYSFSASIEQLPPLRLFRCPVLLAGFSST